ncbi:hypothetical protein ACFQS1_24955 [Paractinoplanes rhizophilus]|uniref:SPOR domain-containing protein n=1 Tax=Paractinoplanes rhizophilus TaxID=1416877 RepID=A0ABW2HZT3_9ACTN|nr:hypothetical protein [Actinoplanes sp.]
MELTLPDEPVALAPGVPTRVPVQLRNPYAQPLELRIFLARGRAAGWATVDPPSLSLAPGETAEVGVVLQTPPEQPPSSSLVPFTVHAEEASTGEPAGFATALLKVALPVPVTGSLAARREKGTYDLWLANDTQRAAPLRITAQLDPPAGSVQVEPDAVLLEPGANAQVTVRAKPGRPITGQPRSWALVVKVSDVYDAEREPYLTQVATGRSKPLVRAFVLASVAALICVAAAAAIALNGGGKDLFSFRGKNAATTTPAVAPATVNRPYALIEVFPHRGADGGRAAAQAEQQKLAAQGMPVRLVDSLASDVLSDEQGGFYVLLQDGFQGTAQAEAYCAQWRAVAPKCRVTS